MSRRWVVAVAAGLVLGSVAVARANAGGGPGGHPARSASRQEHLSDANILAMMKGGDSVEVVLSKWVRERTKNRALRTYTEMLTRDHARGTAEVEALARRVKIRPESPAGDTTGLHNRHVEERMGALSGFDFDTAAARHWIRDHQHDMKDTEHMISEAKNAQVKRGAEKEMPTLRKHLRAAEALERTLAREHGAGAKEEPKGEKAGKRG